MPTYRKSGKYYKKNKGNIFWRRGLNKSYRLARRVARLSSFINPEFKFKDSQSVSITPAQSQTVVQLTNIDQGDTGQTRDGYSIKVVQFHCKYFIQKHASATLTQLRMMLIYDAQTNGAAYAITDILDNGTAVVNLVSPLNTFNAKRFHIFFDKLITLDVNNPQRTFKYFKKLQHHIRYKGTGAGIADVNSGSFSLWFVSSEATNVPNINVYARIRFLDN